MYYGRLQEIAITGQLPCLGRMGNRDVIALLWPLHEMTLAYRLHEMCAAYGLAGLYLRFCGCRAVAPYVL